MPPFWFEALASVALGVSLLCSLYLIVAVMRHPQKMAVMNWVWPVTAHYFGPVAIYAFSSALTITRDEPGICGSTELSRWQRWQPACVRH